MKRFACPAIAALLTAWSLSAAEPYALHVFHHENVLGTSLELKVSAQTEAQAGAAEAAALAEIDRLAKTLSSYDAASEFSRWRKTAQSPVRVTVELFEVLNLFDEWRGRSAGALDASAEVVCKLWKHGAAQHRVPSDEEIAAAVASVKRAHWTLDAAAQTATHLDDAPLILNSFTKSYIASRACDAAMRVTGVGAAVVNIGGDLVVRGDLTEAVDIADPRSDAENGAPASRLRIRDRAVATSGGYRRGVEIAGRKYSHIVDPRNGRPVDHILSATVVAPDATDAGALATTLCVLTPVESLRLVATIAGAECLLITRDGQRVASKGWSQWETPRVQLAAVGEVRGLLAAAPAAGADSGQWNSSFELMVNLELAYIESQRAKRPYVAVWIEDEKQFSVRTLALWFAKPKWLPDLRSWTHSDRLRAQATGTNITHSVSSATRSPGMYTLKWDGKDDKGQFVKPGKYTVFIEAAREHGTHQVMRQEMEFTGTPQKIELKGNVEISSATLDYRRRVEAH
jgi:thiamine biosynthesis lipoprotein ApbE